MEKYPLAPLLKVREYREDAAKNALSAAERAVVEAQEAVERCRGELERYKVWRQEEVERRYDAIMGKGLSLKELDPRKGRKHWGKEGKPFWRDVFPIRLPQICRYGSYPALSNAFCVHYALHFRELSAGWSDSPFKIKKPVHKRRNAGGVVWLTL